MHRGLPLIAAALLSPGSVFAPPVWRDARDVPRDALDIRALSFGQRDTQLWLKVRTTGPPAAGERVCLVLADGPRLCRPGAIPGARVRRAGGSLSARFHPRAAGLAFGRPRWAVETLRAGRLVDR